MTCLSNCLNLRYSGVLLMSGLFSSALSFCSGSDITPPPDWSDDSRSNAFQRPIQELYGSVRRQCHGARCNERIAHQGNGTNGMVRTDIRAFDCALQETPEVLQAEVERNDAFLLAQRGHTGSPFGHFTAATS